MSTLADGREAYAERRWPDAVGQYTAADHDAELPAGDLEQLATSVILTGRGSEGVDILARAHLKYLADGDYPAAARCAVWSGLNLILLGEPARSADICFLAPIAAGELEGRSKIAELARERIVAAMQVE